MLTGHIPHLLYVVTSVLYNIIIIVSLKSNYIALGEAL